MHICHKADCVCSTETSFYSGRMKLIKHRISVLKLLGLVVVCVVILRTLQKSDLIATPRDVHNVSSVFVSKHHVDEMTSKADVLERNFNFSNMFRIDFDEKHGNITDFWESVRELTGVDTLYPRSYDASQVTEILHKAKITYVELVGRLDVETTPKLKLQLEGDQWAIFKLMLIERQNKTMRMCRWGCEHPEYEVTGFTLNRMLDLRNMPFATGRIISWFDELQPVATSQLRKLFQVQEDNSVCLKWQCLAENVTRYCFEDGMIPGAVVYYLKDKIKFAWGPVHIYHGFYMYGAEDRRDMVRLPGDKEFCRKFRKEEKMYRKDRWFLDLVDIAVFDYLMSHHDSKHTMIYKRENDKPEFNVVFDYGHAFCESDTLKLLAPLIQCCRIRTRLFKAMEYYRDTLEETFTSLSKDDPFHPLLLPETMADVKKKLKQTLSFIDFCRHLDGDSRVFIDI